jgi:hypothetical protein
VERADVAPVKSDDEIPYETLDKDEFAVSYNLQLRDDGLGPVYKLTLIMRNKTGEHAQIEPQLTLVDGDGIAIQPYSYGAVRAEAFALAGAKAPPIPASSNTGNRYYEGTVRNTSTGERYAYTARSTSTSSFSDSFAKGYSVGAQVRADRNMEKALRLIKWTDTYWLKGKYSVPPQTAVSGAVLYPGSKKPALPMRLMVEVAGELFEFETSAKK